MSEPAAPGLFDEVLARGPVRLAVSDRAWLRAMLDVEAALAVAQGRLGLIPRPAASTIAEACADAGEFDPAALGRAAARSGNPVLPLVEALRAAVPASVASYVHLGATSQDILDTATMLITRHALGLVLADLTAAADAAARLASAHRATPAAARTLLQHAVPTTVGLKAATWLSALDGARARLASVRHHALAVQLGGAAGTLALPPSHDIWASPDPSGEPRDVRVSGALVPPGGTWASEVPSGEPRDARASRALAMVEAVAGELGLVAPVLPWHTDRTRIADIAGALGTACGAVGKVARDVVLLAQSEVGEVAEAAPGGSSAMAHKRNPVAAVSAAACAAQAPGLVATLLAAMVQEHERAAGAWHAEWRPLRELLVAAGSAASWLRACLDGLTVDTAAVEANLRRLLITTGGEPDTGAATQLVDRALAAHATPPGPDTPAHAVSSGPDAAVHAVPPRLEVPPHAVSSGPEAPAHAALSRPAAVRPDLSRPDDHGSTEG